MKKNEEYFVCKSEGIYFGDKYELGWKISFEEFRKIILKGAKSFDVCICGDIIGERDIKLFWEDIQRASENKNSGFYYFARMLTDAFSLHNALPSVIDRVLPTSGDKIESSYHTFESGAVRDIQEGKGRMDLVPLDVVCDLFSKCPADDFVMSSNYRELAHIENFKNTQDTSYLYLALINFCRGLYISPVTMVIEVSKHFEDSLKKYKENNWKLGIPVNSFINSASRHYLKWLHGDTDEKHDLAFVWNLMCCISTVNSESMKTLLNNMALADSKELKIYEKGWN